MGPAARRRANASPTRRTPAPIDLDLFGRGSLFERVCLARSGEGEEGLAAWLSSPADPEEVRARQAAVAELRDAIDDREQIALLEPPASLTW